MFASALKDHTAKRETSERNRLIEPFYRKWRI